MRVIWIVGASAGIGRAIVRALERTGEKDVRLILSARRLQLLAELQRECNLPTALLPFDLEQPEALGEVTRRAWELFGHIDTLILAAGVSQRGLGLETGWKVYRQIMTIDVDAPVELARQTAMQMYARGSGHIAVISSLAGYVSTPYRSAYCAAKHALHGYFEALRAELSPLITISIVVPGFIRTAISRNALTADGTLYGHMDANQLHGMAPDRCARHILHALSRHRAEIHVGFGLRGQIGYLLRKYTPALLRYLMRLNSGVRKF